ncbi:MAG: FliH/SctL family protein [Gammaproteobacteria bacterium]
MEPVVAERTIAAPVTMDAVVEWLEQGDARERIAAYLADDLTSLRSAARAEGLAAGRTEGFAEAKAQVASVLETLETLVANAELALDSEIDQLAGLCAEVVCETLAKIAGPLLRTREAARGGVQEVLKRVRDERELVVRVSAHDLPALRESAEEIERACGGRKFSLRSDQRIEAGGCIVESSLGTLDGRFDVQLRAVSETLHAAKAAGAEAA